MHFRYHTGGHILRYAWQKLSNRHHHTIETIERLINMYRTCLISILAIALILWFPWNLSQITNSCIMVISWRAAIANYSGWWLLAVIIRHSPYACCVIHASHCWSSSSVAKEPCMNFCWVRIRPLFFIRQFWGDIRRCN